MAPQEEETARREREARSLALEKTYVHDVYRQKARQFSESRHRPWPRVKQFLSELEPGSLVCDVGCGNGKYLTLNAESFFIGGDHCERLAATAAQLTQQQVIVCDALGLPFRDDSMDAAVSVAVIHHLATTERRVRALRELARVLRIGGRLIVTVWAMEQRTRKFESQDVLVPWEQSLSQSSSADGGEKAASAADTEAGTTTSEDDLLAYNALTQNSDTDSAKSNRFQSRRGARRPRRTRAIDPVLASSSQSSSDLSSPSESCYSFVRRALQKLSRRGDLYSSRPRIFSPLPPADEPAKDGAPPGEEDQLIEIRLDDDVTALEDELESQPHRINTRGSDPGSLGTTPVLAAPKSRSVSDVWSLLSTSLLGARKTDGDTSASVTSEKSLSSDRPRSFAFDDTMNMERADSRGLVLEPHTESRRSGRKSVTFSTQSLTLPREAPVVSIGAKSQSDSVLDASRARSLESMRPSLTTSLTTVPEVEPRDITQGATAGQEERTRQKPALIRQDHCADETQSRRSSKASQTSEHTTISAWKQTSLNENLLRLERVREMENLQAHIQKQRSLNESVMRGRAASRSDTLQQAARYKRLKLLRDCLDKLSISLEKISENDSAGPSLKTGIVKMVRQWTETEQNTEADATEDVSTSPPESNEPDASSEAYNASIDQDNYSPIVVEESGASETTEPAPVVVSCALTPTPAGRRALYQHSSRERRISREDSSDSSKENSFQSDTSLDSEDSCVSVIYVPKPSVVPSIADKQRSRSVSSESSDSSSPRSPRSMPLPSPPRTPGPLVPGSLGRINMLKSLPSRLSNNGSAVTSSLDPIAPSPTHLQLSDSKGCQQQSEIPKIAALARTKPETPSASLLGRRNHSPIAENMPVLTDCAQTVRIPLRTQSSEAKSDTNSNEQAPFMKSNARALSSTANAVLASDCIMNNNVINQSTTSVQKVVLPSPLTFPLSKCSSSVLMPSVEQVTHVVTPAPPREPVNSLEASSKSRNVFQFGSEVILQRPGTNHQVSSLVLKEDGEVVWRRDGVQAFRGTQPKTSSSPSLHAFEVFCPETEDLDSESSCASSSSDSASEGSACSVVSQVADYPTAQQIWDLDRDIELQASAALHEAAEPASCQEGATSTEQKQEDSQNDGSDQHIGACESTFSELEKQGVQIVEQVAKKEPVHSWKTQTNQEANIPDEKEQSKHKFPHISAPKCLPGVFVAIGECSAAAPQISEDNVPKTVEAKKACSVADAEVCTEMKKQASLEAIRKEQEDPDGGQGLLNDLHGEQTSGKESDELTWSASALDCEENPRSPTLPPSPKNECSVSTPVCEKLPASAHQKNKHDKPLGTDGSVSLVTVDSVSCSKPFDGKMLVNLSTRRREDSDPCFVEDSGESVTLPLAGESSTICSSIGHAAPAPCASPETTVRDTSASLSTVDDSDTRVIGSSESVAPSQASPRARRKLTLARLDSPLEQVLEEAEPPRPPESGAARQRTSLASSLGSVSSVSDGSRATSLSEWRGSSGSSSMAGLLTSDSADSSALGALTSDSEAAREQSDGEAARELSDSEVKRERSERGPPRERCAGQAADSSVCSLPATANAVVKGTTRSADVDGACDGNQTSVGGGERTSSEESPPPDGGAPFSYHRYYHVFREGELDRLIDKYVDNLHIISSYYDHANWCVIAEKVQVWTI